MTTAYKNISHNKKATNEQDNNRLTTRNTLNAKINIAAETNNHSKNLGRLLMERDGDMFGKDSRMVDNKCGEITGNEYNEHAIDRGLPMRSQYTFKKPVYDGNEHLDFNLFDENPSKLNVKHFDPSENNEIDYSDIATSMMKLSSQVSPQVICSEGIDKLNNNLFYYLFDMVKGNTYTVNGIGLYNLFASLYLLSDGATEIELKKFFDFPKKIHYLRD
jgi:hypothetical protein